MTLFSSLLIAFLVGGALCALAQFLIDLTGLTPARILVLFVVLGVFLGAVGLYEPFFNFAGGGVSVPLLGFGGAVAKGTKKAVDETGLLGALTGPLTAAAGGITAAIIFGYLCALVFKGKPKKM